jgi:hypothetical protein
MATNPLPAPFSRLFTLATDMIDGCTKIGTSTGVVQNTAAVLQAALDAAGDSESTFQSARTAKGTATSAHTTADSNIKSFISTAKRILIPRIGSSWSTDWAEAGFVDNSIETPGTYDERFSLIGKLKKYFADHPAYENAPLEVTSEEAETLHQAAATARSGLTAALARVSTTRTDRETAMDTLRTRMRGLINELDILLPDEDPRWYRFGLSAPGDAETPAIPAAATLTPGIAGSGLLFLDWPDTRRTARYRVWLKKPGEPAFTPVATVTESDATLTGLPLGVLLEFQITALNDAGESTPSPAGSITLS